MKPKLACNSPWARAQETRSENDLPVAEPRSMR